jgi:uncharacterized LabA/DUF88 family protein
MTKKYKSTFNNKRGFFSSADELVDDIPDSKTPISPVISSQAQPVSAPPKSEIKPKHSYNPPNPKTEQQKGLRPQKPSTLPKAFQKRPNFAFIDGQNLNKSIQNQGWSLDYKEFRNYLDKEFGVKKAYMFIGMVNTNQQLYSALQDFGYHLVFKPTIANKQGEIKGNVDAEMVLYALTQINQYDQAVIVSGDGDFYTLVQYLQSQRKLKKLLVPNEKAYSTLYDSLDISTTFVDDLRKTLEYKKK